MGYSQLTVRLGYLIYLKLIQPCWLLTRWQKFRRFDAPTSSYNLFIKTFSPCQQNLPGRTTRYTIGMRISDKHSKITQAAVKVFAKKGFFNARISDIAKEAKVADGTIYLYFNNKYDILISLFEDEIGKIILQVKRLLEEEKDPKKQLYIFTLHHLRLLDEKKDLAEVLQMELRQSNKFMKEYRNTKFIEYIDIISAIIHLGQEKGIFAPQVAPGIAKRAIFGALDEMSRLWVLREKPPYSIEETAQQLSNLFINGLIKQPQ